jgi:uncharacterized membrane protein
MIIAFITISFFVSLFFAIVWNASGVHNTIVKMFFIVLSVWSGYLILQFLPTVELSGQMRLL